MTAGGFALLRPDLTSGASASSVQTVAVTTGAVTSTVSADGSVQPASEVAANFETSGTVDSVRVEVGDTVAKGQMLATLDTADAERAVEVARLSLTAAQEGLDAAEEGITTTEPDTQVVNQSKVARRKAAVTTAQNATQQAQSALQAAQESLAAAQRGTPVDPNAVAQAQTAAAAAQSAYDKALAAQTKAEISLATAQQGTTVAGDTTTTVDDASVANARAKVLEAQSTYDDARSALAACVLKAPAHGTVLEVNGKVGSSAGSSASSSTSGASATTASTSSSDFVVIADLDELEVSVAFAESDVTDIDVGQEATLTFPGLDDATGTGEVTSISPTATTSSSVVTYAALVAIT
jgi:multidrug efflux pump subunit AcrA (membrane-fusion protein)